MSDHISGPRALADPIADITDVYAFPSPERPGHLVLVMNTLPFAKPSDALSDGLVYRFRLRPLTAGAPDDPVPFAVGARGVRRSTACSPPRRGGRRQRRRQEGTCTTPAGETVSFRVNDEQGGSAHGRARLRRPALGSVHHGRPRGVEDDRDGQAGVHRSRARSSWTARTSSAWSSRSTRALLGGAELVGVVAETLTRGRFNVRIERVGRPEVKNMMLAPKQFDPVNRDLEIRDLYNMEDAFHLGRRLPGRLPGAAERQPRLLGRARRQGRLAAGRRTATIR